MSRQIKVCCSAFYESDVARVLLGDVFHPGGLILTQHLGDVLQLGPDDQVLDVACGQGASAVHLADNFGCSVTGLDYGHENVITAERHAAENGVASLTSFQRGDAEQLPFDDGVFDVVISECSFCTMPRKAAAAAEMDRVLAPRGRLGLTDMTLHGGLPSDVDSLLTWVACVGGAGTSEDYIATLAEAGFTGFAVEDHSRALVDMVADVRRRLLGIEVAVGLGRLDLDDLDLEEGKRLARRAVELIEARTVGYTLIVARKAVVLS